MTQDETVAILKTGANVFLTGEPGSGKTYTINKYVAYARSRGIEPAITASTGIAATHIGGYTVHSWSGIGVRRDLTAYDLDGIAQNRNISRRIGDARILIIDEVSMLSAQTFSMIDAVCREIRRNQGPFGGLQVILVGDFFQLPPITARKDDTHVQQSFVEDKGQKQFAFASSVWEKLNPLVCYLSEQHRQEDAAFLGFLSAVRRGIAGESERALLRTRYRPLPVDGITQLYSHNANVDAINDTELSKLSEKTKTFDMESHGPEKLVASLKRGCLSPEVLKLKVGARVMFTKNDNAMHKYVNGTLGVVTGFADTAYPIIKTNAGKTVFAEPAEWHIEDGGRPLARIMQVPLRLAWAMTVHKSQGMSLDAAHMDLSDTFEYGQGYVALSRVRTLAGLTLAGLNQRALEVHPEILLKDVEFRAASNSAQEKFRAMDPAELAIMHSNFIHACGGRSAEAVIQAGESGIAQGKAMTKKALSTYEATRALVARKLSLTDMAKERNVTVGTIMSHLEKLAAEKKINPARDLAHIERDLARFKIMKKALISVYKKEKKMPLASARALLGESYSYDELRLARLFVVL